MENNTTRLQLPLLASGQAQKDVYHNEALVRLDAALAPSLMGASATPPSVPDDGEAWRVLPEATGAWAQHSDEIATWYPGGWTFFRPLPGYIAWDQPAGSHIVFDGTDWRESGWPVRTVEVSGKQVLGPRRPAIVGPSGGAVVDAEARVAIAALLAAARAHGLIEP